jgi:hypothetical protein
MKIKENIVAGVLIVCTAVLCASVIYVDRFRSTRARTANTREAIIMILEQAELYRCETGAYPQGIDELVRWSNTKHPGILTGARMPTDAWGNKFDYGLIESNLVITSSGKDCLLGTEDDIRNANTNVDHISGSR